MGEMACPQCGNPNLDVDEQNSVVYCQKCGFAVKVDPQTGQATPISQGQAQGGLAGAGGQPTGGGYGGGERSIFGMDPLTFWMAGFAILLLLFFLGVLRDVTILVLLLAVLTAVWWMKK
ncbi:MAG: hypothetical protein Q8R15_01695 [Candidatus Micrarchaeota archaeon]|nr:hypothetical protein [Candidatus Micrarchaeota archaeon]